MYTNIKELEILERMAKFFGISLEDLKAWKIQAEKNDIDALNGVHNLYYAIKLMYYFEIGKDGEEQNIIKLLRNINHIKSNCEIDNNLKDLEKHINKIQQIKNTKLQDLY